MAELIRIDTEAYQVWKGDQEIRLSLTRFHLLATLIANAGCVVSRRQLYLAVWGHDWGTLSKTLHMHLVWLRRALGDDARQPTYITTVSGVGWRFEASMVAPSPEVSHDAVQAAAVAILNASCLCKDDRDDLRFTVEAHGGASTARPTPPWRPLSQRSPPDPSAQSGPGPSASSTRSWSRPPTTRPGRRRADPTHRGGRP
nr:hypothetical protein GCM10020093_084080 [Planobispora longispora]